MIEQLLADLVEAVEKNTAALNAKTGAAAPVKGKVKPKAVEDEEEDEDEDERPVKSKGKPAKGKPVKDEDDEEDEDEEEEEDEDDEDEAPAKGKKAAPPAKAKAKGKKVTLDDVKKALRDYAELEGKPAAKAILKTHGEADTPAELEEENYQAVIDACNE